jgi:hypothetical protein
MAGVHHRVRDEAGDGFEYGNAALGDTANDLIDVLGVEPVIAEHSMHEAPPTSPDWTRGKRRRWPLNWRVRERDLRLLGGSGGARRWSDSTAEWAACASGLRRMAALSRRAPVDPTPPPTVASRASGGAP